MFQAAVKEKKTSKLPVGTVFLCSLNFLTVYRNKIEILDGNLYRKIKGIVSRD
jgi:hypothetical protein